MRRTCTEYIFLSEIKGSESMCVWDRLSCHRDQHESAFQNRSTVVSSHRRFHHTGCNRILSGMKPLRLGAMFGCKIVTELSLRRMSSPSLQAWSVHCQLQCKGRPQKLLWGWRETVPEVVIIRAIQATCTTSRRNQGVLYDILMHLYTDIYIHVYTYKHMYTQKQIY